MPKFILKVNYSIIACSLLSGCNYSNTISLHVQNSSLQQPFQTTDKIIILASRPDLENTEEFKTAKFRTKFYFQKHDYTVVEKNSLIKPSLFVLLEPSITIKSTTVTRQVCKDDSVNFYQETQANPNDPNVSCYDHYDTFDTYI